MESNLRFDPFILLDQPGKAGGEGVLEAGNESADRVHILLAFGVELPGNLVRQWGDVGDSAAGDLLAELEHRQAFSL